MKLYPAKMVAVLFVLMAFPVVSSAQTQTNTDKKDGAESQSQPQGETGPLNTKSGGAPAASPQGDTPAGMQAAPKGSSETIRTDKSGKPEGTPKD
jgi:hypothetical protein